MAALRMLAKPVPATTAPSHEGLLQRPCACGGSAGFNGECKECQKKKLPGTMGLRLQTKLEIGEPDDRYEREAERIANQMVGRDVSHNEENNGADVAQIPLGWESPRTTTDLPPIVREVLNSPGQPLDYGTRGFFEARFGHDFSRVRVHTDTRAAESAKTINALGYTVAPHIVLSRGQYAPGSLAGRRLIAHELTHIVQQSQPRFPAIAPRAGGAVAHTDASRETPVGPAWGTVSQHTEGAILQRSPAPAAPTRKVQPTDEDLLELLNRFDPGEPVVLYHVDADGGLLRSIQEVGWNFSLKKGELNLTTNVEVRTGFKGGAGLDNIIAFYVDSRFVSLLQELALSQRGAGAVEETFNEHLLKLFAEYQKDIRQKAIEAGEDPGRVFAGIKKPKAILAVPRYTFEGGGRGQGRALFGTGDYNIALRSFKGVSEWYRLFKLSIKRIDHLRYDDSLPSGNRLVPVAQLYPVRTGPIPGGAPPTSGPGPEGDLPTMSLGLEAGALLPGQFPENKPSVTSPASGETPLVSTPVSGTTPLPPRPVSGSRPLLTGPVSGQTPLLTGPTVKSPTPSGSGSPPGSSGEPTARDVVENPNGKMVSAPRPSPEGEKIPSLAEGAISPESSLAGESMTKALGEGLNEPPSVSAPGLISEKGEAAAYVGALVVDVAARRFADYVTGLQTGKAQDAVSKLIPQILSKLKDRSDLGVIITVAYSQQTPDLFGVDQEVPRTFLWASFDLVLGVTLSEAQSHFDNVYPEPAEGELRDYRYEWFPPPKSNESPQNWHSVQWNSESWTSRLRHWWEGL